MSVCTKNNLTEEDLEDLHKSPKAGESTTFLSLKIKITWARKCCGINSKRAVLQLLNRAFHQIKSNEEEWTHFDSSLFLPPRHTRGLFPFVRTVTALPKNHAPIMKPRAATKKEAPSIPAGAIR